MAETGSLIKPRHMAVAGVMLVGIQLGLVAIFDFKPPQFHAGYEAEQTLTDAAEPLSSQRLQQLEAMLSPAPVLSFVAPTQDADIAAIITPENGPNGAVSDPDPGLEAGPKDVPAATAGDAPLEMAMIDPPAEPLIIPKVDRKPLVVAPIYIETLPDLSGLTVDQRKTQFIAFMLPLILRANLELDHRRKRIDVSFRAGDSEKLRQWAQLYNFDPASRSDAEIYAELKQRVRPVPVSIALAQAAIESGWGTSRFAIEGNAVYGQWAWSQDAGIRPLEARYDNAVVRSFNHLFESIRAYMHNLNTHHAYDRFRRVRQETRDAPIETRLPALIATLDQYSEKRDIYIATLFDVMEDNLLWDYETALLTEE
ncbi:MAG: glucosaminidase domain-containing protein [Candidatus Puniceispirillales bacterium]